MVIVNYMFLKSGPGAQNKKIIIFLLENIFPSAWTACVVRVDEVAGQCLTV